MSTKTLVDLKGGESGVITGYLRGSGAVTRLIHMGLTIGTPFKIVEKLPWGPIIVEVRGSSLCIGRGLASGILIKNI